MSLVKKNIQIYPEITTADMLDSSKYVNFAVYRNTDTGQIVWNNGTKWQASNEPSTLKIGDIANGNYSEFESDGTLVAKGDATTYDDLNVNVNSIPLNTANNPEKFIVANDGSATTGYSFDFDGNANKGIVDYFAGMDTDDLTIAMWTNADTTTQNELIDRNVSGGFEFYVNNQDLYFSPSGGSSVQASNVILGGANQFLVATARLEGANLRCKLYVDGNNVAESVINTTLYKGSGGGYILGEYNSGGWNYDGRMDNIQTYNKILTDAQILELYNNGEGTNSLPTGIIATTDLIVYFQDDYSNQTTMASATDFTNSGTTLVDGLIGITSGSKGVTALKFSKDVVNELFFTVQLPHSYKEGSNIEPHVHWGIGNSSETGNVVWGLEYIWVNVDENWGNTTIVEDAITAPVVTKHSANNIAVIDGTGKKISSVLQCRLYRNPNDALDTFNDVVYLGDFDFHFEINTQGSRTTWVK